MALREAELDSLTVPWEIYWFPISQGRLSDHTERMIVVSKYLKKSTVELLIDIFQASGAYMQSNN